MTEESIPDRCPSCGAIPVGDHEDCKAMWDFLLAESFSNLVYARFHRLIVDLYALQHPETYCISAKSTVAHLTGLCCHVEHGGDPGVNTAVQRLLNGTPDLEKPTLPQERGRLTIAHVVNADRSQVATRVDEWATDVWSAYSELHQKTRSWILRSKSPNLKSQISNNFQILIINFLTPLPGCLVMVC